MFSYFIFVYYVYVQYTISIILMGSIMVLPMAFDGVTQGLSLSAYEDQTVTVVGTYSGPSTYTTVMGGDRTVPTITHATIA